MAAAQPVDLQWRARVRDGFVGGLLAATEVELAGGLFDDAQRNDDLLRTGLLRPKG